MKFRKLVSFAALALVVGCSDYPDDSIQSVVSFGDSLSDVGSYRTAGVASMGGGQYTVNGAALGDTPSVNWTEVIAEGMELAVPCAARTGLESSGPLAAMAGAVTDHAGCTNYAQGGSRVSEAVGPWNKALLALNDPSGYLGQLTEPVSSQVSHHLRLSNGRFNERVLVTVWAGANDLFMQLFQLQAAVAGGADATQASAAAVQAMAAVGTELGTLVKDQIVAKGARRVLVLNLPDIGLTPFAAGLPAGMPQLMTAMAGAFNAALASALTGDAKIVLVDVFATSQDQHQNPVDWLLSNTTTPACDDTKMAIPSALVCSSPASLVAGDTEGYLYADSVHPTPMGHLWIAVEAYAAMVEADWVEELVE